MVLRPRRDRHWHRFVDWQVGFYFLAAGIWLGGVIAGRPSLTGVAIGLLVAALLLGMIGRRLDRPVDDGETSVDPEEDGPADGDPQAGTNQ